MHAALLTLVSTVALGQVTIVVDPTADQHPISPNIYGVNYASPAQVTEGGITATRWGGNSTTRYNYEIDVTNTGNDYFFENVPGCWDTGCSPVPADPKASSGANTFLADVQAQHLTALFTVPTMGFVAKGPPVYGHPFPCGCPRTLNGNQDSYDQWDNNCGNGQVGGQNISCAAPTTTSMTITSAWSTAWATYLVGRFGASNGQRVYALDNEPNLWNSTHRDVHPAATTYDELWQAMRDHAVALLAVDPTAQTSGPAEWGWPNYFCSAADNVQNGCFATSPDRAAHGGIELTSWLLQQAHAWEQAHGQRILHYLDLHYYPQGGSTADVTRSLWDPTYQDPSWVNDTIRLIPRMREWVAANYPGTKLAISEYDFYHHNEPLGAVLYTDVLGIFGREGVHLATAWSAPLTTDAAFSAYRLYGNYDGQGSRFESTGVRATTSLPGMNVYAATSSTRMTVVLVNGTNATQTVNVNIGSFSASGPAQWWARGSGSAIVRAADIASVGSVFPVSVPSMGTGMLVFTGSLTGFVGTDGGSAGGTGGSAGGSGGSAGGTGGSAGGTGGSAGGGKAGAGGSCGCSSVDELSLVAMLGLLVARARRRS